MATRLQQRLSPKLALGLVLPVVALLFSACFSVDQSHGQISPKIYAGAPAAEFTLHSNYSYLLAYSGYFGKCNASISCTINLVYGQAGNDLIANEALDDCNPTDNGLYDPLNGQVEICGYDLDQTLWNEVLTCPGGPYCNSGWYDWQQRCIAFTISNGGAVSELLNWNLSGAYFVFGTWTWYRPGNGNCQD